MAFIIHIHAARRSWGPRGRDWSALPHALNGPGPVGVGRQNSTCSSSQLPSPKAVPEADDSLLLEHKVWLPEKAPVGVNPRNLHQSLPF